MARSPEPTRGQRSHPARRGAGRARLSAVPDEGPITTPRRPVEPKRVRWVGPAGPMAAALFGALTRARRARVFHPQGSGYHAEVVITPSERATGAPFLDRPGSFEAVVRFSRGAGIPDPVPDVLGLAIKVLDAHGPEQDHDWLLVTSATAPLGRHLLVPTTGFLGRPFSSVLPYLVGRRVRIFGALPATAPVHDGGTALAEVHVAATLGELKYDLVMAGEFGGWRAIGQLRIDEPLDQAEADALQFNPWNTGPAIMPLGVLQALRRYAYAGSQNQRR